MKKGLILSFFIVSNLFLIQLHAQGVGVAAPLEKSDTIETAKVTLMHADTLSHADANKLNKELNVKLVKPFEPNSTKAVLYALVPGMGQIYNRKYWKLPIVYGGFLGVIYAFTWNGNMYTDYQNAYKDIMIDPARRTRWHSFVVSPQKVLDNSTEMDRTKAFLKHRRDTYRRNRDLAIIVGAGLYALTMIDAYVDAQLYNFTVTPDLSMRMAPVVWGPSEFSNSITVGFQCNIVF